MWAAWKKQIRKFTMSEVSNGYLQHNCDWTKEHKNVLMDNMHAHACSLTL